MKKQKEKGITLIALVVTIIVLLILAGISIMMLTGENSLINQAKNAKVITGKAQIEEAVKLAYGSASIDKYTNDNAITLGKVAEELEKDGYEIEIRSSSGSSEVTGIEINPPSVTLEPAESETGNSATVEVKLQQEMGADSRYYVKKDGKYYEFVIENNEVKVLEPVTDIDGAGGENKIQVSSSDENIVKAELNEETRIITLTAKSNSGSATITVKYGDFEKTCNVKIQVKPIESGTVNPETSMEIGYGTIDVVWLSGNSKTPTTIPNSPENHLSGMSKVTWTKNADETWSEDSTANSTWYNYLPKTDKTDNTSSMWANAKNNDSYFVWIPRYAYRITYYESQDAWKNGEDPTGYYDGYGMWSAGTKKLKYKLDDGIQTTTYNGMKYIVHPAFTGIGTEEQGGGFGTDSNGIEGFWVAKYEMSRAGATATSSGSGYNTTFYSKPNVQSARSIAIGNMYTVGLAYDTAKESHMMKNSEWGAVAYLTQSQYGRNGYEIDINNSSSYVTGTGGGATNASSSGTKYEYNTKTGAKASTTGNIYGIYDMSGGAWDRVASYDKLGNSKHIEGASYALNMTKEAKDENGNYISTKYITAYKNGTSTYMGTAKEHEVGKIGDATKELNTQGENDNSHWFSDYSYVVDLNNPVVKRGGYCINASSAGIFCSSSAYGAKNDSNSFRIVLIP